MGPQVTLSMDFFPFLPLFIIIIITATTTTTTT
jgi:hypothetical protein